MRKHVFLIILILGNLLADQKDIIGLRITFINTIKREAQHAIWTKNSLTPEQLQILLNFTCVSFDLINAEHKLQEEAMFILLMSWHLRYDREKFINGSEHLLTVERSFERFRNLLKAQQILTQAYEDLEKTINKQENQALADVANTMQSHATQLINYFSSAQSQEIKQILIDSAKHITQTISSLHGGSQTFQALIEGAYPFEHPLNKELQTIELAQKLVESSVAPQSKKLLEVSESIWQETKHIQTFGALVFYIYYKITYEGMLERALDDSYFSMLFENNCLISGDKKTNKLKEPLVDTNIPLLAS